LPRGKNASNYDVAALSIFSHDLWNFLFCTENGNPVVMQVILVQVVLEIWERKSNKVDWKTNYKVSLFENKFHVSSKREDLIEKSFEK
jgi:hypothetical protein